MELTRRADRAVTCAPADVIVAVSPPAPCTALVLVVQRLGIPYQVVGDANAPGRHGRPSTREISLRCPCDCRMAKFGYNAESDV